MSAAAEHHQPVGLRRTLTWRGGFALALVIPMSGLTLVGYEIGAIGAYGALAVWVVVSVVALAQNYIYAELAGIYPEKSGGISLYASETWSRYCPPLGGILGWGYWAGWSLTLAVVSLVIGDLVQAEWFPKDTGTVTILGNHVGLPTYIAAAVVIAVYLLNISGLKPVVNTNVVIGAALVLLAAVALIGPIVLGQLHAASLTFSAGHGAWSIIATLFTWAFVASWTAYGTEIAATFTPEYRDPHRDMARALQTSALLMIVVVALSSTILPAAVGQSTVAGNPIGFFAILVSHVLGSGFGGVAIAIVCAAQLIALGSATSDSGRVLYGMAGDRLTVRQLHKLNRAGQPARGMTVDLVFNLLVLFLVSNVAGIIFASNLGYLLSVVFALGGFLLLRRTQPGIERPIRLGRGWVPVAVILVAFNAVMIVIGFTHPALVGYGGGTEQLISLSVIVVGLASYLYARVVQDRKPAVFFQRTGPGTTVGAPAVPVTAPAEDTEG
ncbi:MAG: APC family permease [Streptosporangiaceae bacterium]